MCRSLSRHWAERVRVHPVELRAGVLPGGRGEYLRLVVDDCRRAIEGLVKRVEQLLEPRRVDKVGKTVARSARVARAEQPHPHRHAVLDLKLETIHEPGHEEEASAALGHQVGEFIEAEE